MTGMLHFLIRTSAFLRKEIFTILRQPRLLLTLIIGPFLILLVFGVGYRNENRLLKTLFVVPEESKIKAEVEAYADRITGIEFAGITDSAEEADIMLRQQEVDLVIVTPVDPLATVREDEQAPLQFYHYEIDPFEETFVRVLQRAYVDEINEQVLLRAVDRGKAETGPLHEKVEEAREEAAAMRQALEANNRAAVQEHRQALREDLNLLRFALGSSLAVFNSVQDIQNDDTQLEAVDSMIERLRKSQERLNSLVAIGAAGGNLEAEREELAAVEEDLKAADEWLAEFQEIDSHVLVSPFRGETLSVTNTQIEPTHFFVPAVIALLLQHMAITMAALSIVRERREGSLELFRASPVSPFETLLGKYLSFLLLCAVLAAVLTGLIIYILDVPMLGNWWSYALVLLILTFTSLSIGFVISVYSLTDSQAVQYSMIILLASIFFSGFFIALYRLLDPVHIISWLLPATYGTAQLQNIMLRGKVADPTLNLGLLGLGIVLFALAWWRLRRLMVLE